ncbi:SgcJ/EcaC family oxidoreductase [Gramella sp. KN1008]|uniref:YybH family protein n=1 Tax=Gramella sp. KN1008 TaxID=2529298 RepID=UPI001038D867|nr:SgcJ/EcaC family oxidoreductase [Gramella sp. KN1008]TBW29993.1 SgcJ/EcaC family oxidoreductase [Gramella sp. KN1008]
MKRSAFYSVLAGALLILSVSACNNKVNEPEEKEEMEATTPKDTFSLEKAKTEIIDANSEFASLFNEGDSTGVANLYTDDAKFMMEGSPAITGRENIQSAIAGIKNSGISRVDLRTIEVWGDEDMVVEEGELTLYREGVEVDRGKYMVLWKKEDGQWKLFRDIFNSNLSSD